MRGHDADDEDDCVTLTPPYAGRGAPQVRELQQLQASDKDRGNRSSSPSSRGGGGGLGDFLQDLSEMSSLADRIDSILDQTASEHSTRSGGRMRSHSPMPQIHFEAQCQGDEEQMGGDDGEEEEQEVD